MGRHLLFIAALLVANPSIAQDREALVDKLDRFAAAYFDHIQPLSIADGVEYCGFFGIDSAGNLAATPARPGEADSCLPDDEPEGFEVLASYHTHGAYDRNADTEVPSLDDLTSDIDEGIDGYVATPGGRLWLNDIGARESILLCGPGCVRADPAYRPCPAFPPGKRHTIDSLRERADNDTGDC